MLAALEGELGLGLAAGALKTKDDLLGSLGLLVEDWLGLTTVTRLLSIVTTLSLGDKGGLNILLIGVLHSPVDRALCTFPALYWVTLWRVCLRHSLPLQ